MKNKKISTKQEIQLLIAFLGILLAVIVYYFVYSKYNEKSDALELSNNTLQTEVSRLLILNNKREDYISETSRMQSYIKEFESKFPSAILYEDSIMMVKNMEDSTRTSISTISFGAQTPVVYVAQNQDSASLSELADPNTAELAAADAVANGTPAATANNSVISTEQTVYADTTLYEYPLGLTLECTYDDFKGLIRYIYAQQERMSVKAVNISYNSETGSLAGDMTLDTYFLIGTDKAYTEPKIPAMDMGVDTIFGNVMQSVGESE